MFEVQDKTGLVADANAYVSVEDFRQYFQDRAMDTAGWLDAQVEGAIVSSTLFMDTVFDYLGEKIAGDAQTTEFPRYLNTLPDPPEADIPKEVIYACCEYTMYVLSGKSLMISLEPSKAGISEIEEEVAEIRKRVKYLSSNSDNPVAILPFAELLLAKSGWLYTKKNNVVIRA